MERFTFHDYGVLHEHLDSLKSKAKKEILEYNDKMLLNVNEEELAAYFFNKFAFVAPTLNEEEIVIDNSNVSKDGHSSNVIIRVPFEGNSVLFHYRPMAYSWKRPIGYVDGKTIILSYTISDYDKDKFNSQLQIDLRYIKKYLTDVQHDVERYNKDLDGLIRQTIKDRKAKLIDNQEFLHSLGIPVRKRGNLPTTYEIPNIRRKPKITYSKPKSHILKPEPVLSPKVYEEILETCFNMALVMERNPTTFAKMDEEQVRNLFLMFLNGQYEGMATGETFNFQGKTDILIRVEDKNVFIAECKFWQGERSFVNTIDQLFRYTSWRDTRHQS